MDENIQLGGNIELAGFNYLGSDHMIVAKKIIGNYARKFQDKNGSFERLKITLKPVHPGDRVKKIEVHGQLETGGKKYNVEFVDHNLYVALDNVLKRLDRITENRQS